MKNLVMLATLLLNLNSYANGTQEVITKTNLDDCLPVQAESQIDPYLKAEVMAILKKEQSEKIVWKQQIADTTIALVKLEARYNYLDLYYVSLDTISNKVIEFSTFNYPFTDILENTDVTTDDYATIKLKLKDKVHPVVPEYDLEIGVENGVYSYNICTRTSFD